MKKVIIPGLLAGVLMVLVDILFSYLVNLVFPSIMNEYVNIALFRPWNDPKMSLYFVTPFITAWAIAYLWNKFKGAVKTKGLFKRGLMIGLFVFFISTLPGMVISYGTFQISMAMALSWTVMSFIDACVAGWVIAGVNKK
jgi:hypothetical protein